MNHPLRTTSAVSLVALASMIAGCASPRAHFSAASHVDSKADKEVGFATRALAALNANDVPQAIDFSEKAVARTPEDAALRTLLGNAYLAGGRFHSAETSFRDSLTLNPDQAPVVLKLALVQIAQGKNNQALALLNDARNMLDTSDYGLALALAGRPAEAIAILDPAARRREADATVRQNLALAHALAGEWTEARTIAAQDVPANQLDARIQQWMQLASPKKASDQVASLIGVTPAVTDAGQPVRLALKAGGDTLMASAQPVNSTPAPAPFVSAPAAPVVTASVAAPAISSPAPVVVAVAPAPPPPRSTMAALAATAITEAKAVLASVMPNHAAPVVKSVARSRPVALVAARRGNSPAVVQLGAYGSPERVLTAWNGAAKKYGALKAYLPMSARFASSKGTFYRLSVRGFESVSEAASLCKAIRVQGGTCFVRNFAGDAPMQMASR